MSKSEPTTVYGVHAVRPREITATELITADLPEAEVYASTLSEDPGVLAGAVTRYFVGVIGRRTPVAMYVAGARQEVPHVSDDRRVFANGHGAASRYAPR